MRSILIIGLLTTVWLTRAQAQSTDRLYSDSIRVYVSLHDECIISSYYTHTLRDLVSEYADIDPIDFLGLWPWEGITQERIDAWDGKHGVHMRHQIDYDQEKVRALGIHITPEVVVMDEGRNKILYKGRIDDSYARVGIRRRVQRTHELRSVLKSIINNKPIDIPQREAIGCYISYRMTH